jgi:hypothetical protein
MPAWAPPDFAAAKASRSSFRFILSSSISLKILSCKKPNEWVMRDGNFELQRNARKIPAFVELRAFLAQLTQVHVSFALLPFLLWLSMSFGHLHCIHASIIIAVTRRQSDEELGVICVIQIRTRFS